VCRSGSSADALRRDLRRRRGVIARRQPLASDLDEILGLSHREDLDGSGSGEEHAKRAVLLLSRFPEDNRRKSRAAAKWRFTVERSSRCYAVATPAIARRPEAGRRDRSAAYERLPQYRCANERRSDSSRTFSICSCAKNIERVATRNHIAEAAYLLATGYPPDGERRRLDESSNITGDTFVANLS